MRKLLISAAALTLLGAAAWAQPDHDHHGGPQGQQQHPQGPQGGPHPGGRPDHGPGGNRGAAPAARPQPQAQARPQPQRPAAAPGNNRPGFANPGNNRPGFANPGNNRPGFAAPGNRPGGNNGFNRGGARNYSGLRNYHQNVQASRRFHGPSYNRPSGWYSRRWSFGQILPRLFWAQQYWIGDYGAYDLEPPPPGTVWVRDGNDALLIDQDSGEIISVEYDVFY